MGLTTRLNLGAALSLLLVLAVTAAVWELAQDYEEDVSVTHHTQLHGAARLIEAESALWQLRYGFPQFMIGDAAAQRRILDEEPKWHAVIDGALAAYGDGHIAPEEREALVRLRSEYERYRAAQPKFFELWQAGRKQEAIDWLALTATPYGAATIHAFERQIAVQHEIAERDQVHDKHSVARTKNLIIVISASLIVLMALGYLTALRQIRPLIELRARAVRTVREVFGNELDAAGSGNEVAALVQTVDAMTEKFAEHADALARSRDELERESQTLEQAVASRTEALAQTVACMERQNREISLRNELGDLLQSCISVEEAGAVVARFAVLLFPGASGGAYMHISGDDTLLAVVRWGAAGIPESLPATDCWALRRGKTHLVLDPADPLRCPHTAGTPEGASICVPLAAHGETLGLLHLACSGACLPGGADVHEREHLAEALAAQIGMALANLRLRESLHQQSIRDPLTGLYNRRYLEGALPRELSRAGRGGRPLAVFMLDVDHFKLFNDNHGHDAGDAVLRALGKALRESCRQGDIACRFGGEEFTLILPDADEHAAREWAERLLLRVRMLEAKADGKPLPKITISLGLALYPQHGDDGETLMQAADLALYDAKHTGRDRLAVAGGESPPIKGEGDKL